MPDYQFRCNKCNFYPLHWGAHPKNPKKQVPFHEDGTMHFGQCGEKKAEPIKTQEELSFKGLAKLSPESLIKLIACYYLKRLTMEERIELINSDRRES